MARSLCPEPPYLGNKLCPLSRVLVTIAGFYKNIPFPGFFREIFPRETPTKCPLTQENGNTHAAPSVRSSVCVWGGGGGGRRSSIVLAATLSLTVYACHLATRLHRMNDEDIRIVVIFKYNYMHII